MRGKLKHFNLTIIKLQHGNYVELQIKICNGTARIYLLKLTF